MDKLWKKSVEKVDFAFQPIINISDGTVYGYELLLRNYENAGFKSIQDFFDTAYEDGVLYQVDLALREKGIEKYKKIKNYKDKKMFYNIDNRVLEMADYSTGNTSKIITKHCIDSSNIIFEISERHKFQSVIDMKNVLTIYKQQGYKIAVDDYGSGYSGLQLLYYTEPDIIKIDKFFIENINIDYKKKLFINNVINLAHLLGIKVIAEGVESEEQFKTCRDIGCDFIQGYFIQRPVIKLDKLEEKYIHISQIEKNKVFDENRMLIKENIDYIECVKNRSGISEIFELFKKNPKRDYFVVVNNNEEPIGIIREESIKSYVYSPYGKELLLNEEKYYPLKKYVTQCVMAEISEKYEKIIELFSMNEEIDGIIITKNGKYKGVLSARSLIKIISEKNIAAARDQNPLTKLPGNIKIKNFIEKSLEDIFQEYILIYYDFDNFKPFNDIYGFDAGDRAILMFADILKKNFEKDENFIGHIGGDDFFVGLKSGSIEKEILIETAKASAVEFRNEVLKLYKEEDKIKGYIVAQDRYGIERIFKSITVSFSLIVLKKGKKELSEKQIFYKISELKKSAKDSKEGYVIKEI